MGAAIRQVGPEEAATVARLVRQLLAHVLPPEKVMAEEMLLAAARSLLLDGKIVAFLAEDDIGTPVGLATVTEMHAIFAAGTFGEITELYVDPAFRSKTVGEALVEACKVHGREQGWTRIELSAPPAGSKGAERAWAFYERIGFANVGPRMMVKL